MNATTKNGHLHGEAFMLMWYACNKCPHHERIWNSRDGVTPFGMDCPSCGGVSSHVDWKRDEYAPNHKLHRHQRFWRDGTIAEARAIMERRIEQSKGTQYEVSAEYAKQLLSDEVLTTSEFQTGWPMLGEKQ